MRKFIFSILICLVVATTAATQNYKALEWDVLGAKYLITHQEGDAIGLFSALRVNLNDRIAVGLKQEWQFFGDYFSEPIRGQGIGSSIALTADYYVLNNSNSRGFVGVAVGHFNNSETTQLGEDVGGSGWGFVPRIGYKYAFLRVIAEYNYTFKQGFPNFAAIGLAVHLGGRSKI